MTRHGLSNSTSSEGRATGHTHCICYPQMFYIPSLPTGHHRLKDAKGVRDPAVGSRMLPQEQHIWATAWGTRGKKDGLCPCVWAVLAAAAHSQLLFSCGLLWSAGLQAGNVGVTGQGLWIWVCVLQEHCWWREGLDPLCYTWTTQSQDLGKLWILVEKYLWIAKRYKHKSTQIWSVVSIYFYESEDTTKSKALSCSRTKMNYWTS